MKKALSSTDILVKKHKTFEFSGAFLDAFDRPSRVGTWFIWGNSGNGKNNFLLQLAKELSKFEKIYWWELEEFQHDTFQKAWQRNNMHDCKTRIKVIDDTLDELRERLKKRESPNIVIINSYQYTFMSFKDYLDLKNEFPKKLFVIISQCEGKNPVGKTALKVMYDASLKIWVEGYKAFSKGRYIGSNGGEYVIWEDGAANYWGNININ